MTGDKEAGARRSVSRDHWRRALTLPPIEQPVQPDAGSDEIVLDMRRIAVGYISVTSQREEMSTGHVDVEDLALERQPGCDAILRADTGGPSGNRFELFEGAKRPAVDLARRESFNEV